MAVYYFCMVNMKVPDKPAYIYVLNALMIMFFFYGMVYVLEGDHFYLGVTVNKPFNYLKGIMNSLLPIYVFYYFAWKGVLTKRYMQVLTSFFFIVIIISYWNEELESRSILAERGGDRDGVVNNMGYEFLCLFPVLVFFDKRPWLQYLGLICVMTFVVMGMKRGAILIGTLCMVWFLLEMFRMAKRYKKLLIVVVSAVVVVIMAYLVWHLLQTSTFFNQRLQATIEGNTSGRDFLFATFLNYFLYDTTFFQFLLGSGANATLEVSVNYAHNDWLELAVNQGVLGIVLYAIYWISFFQAWRSMSGDRLIGFAFGLVLLIYFVRTFFSFSYGGMSIYSTSVLGFCLGAGMRGKEEKSMVV
jgi:O-antigen ligase